MCAFPLHLWTLLLSFRDISWVSERTSYWDAVGVISYGMVFAFMETILCFLIAVPLGFLISTKWERQRRVALLGSLVLLLGLWSILSQLYFLLGWSLPSGMIDFLVKSEHPLRILYPTLFVLVTASVLYPTYAVLHSGKSVAVLNDLMDRFSLLTMAYLIVDVIALCIVILRNILGHYL